MKNQRTGEIGLVEEDGVGADVAGITVLGEETG